MPEALRTRHDLPEDGLSKQRTQRPRKLSVSAILCHSMVPRVRNAESTRANHSPPASAIVIPVEANGKRLRAKRGGQA